MPSLGNLIAVGCCYAIANAAMTHRNGIDLEVFNSYEVLPAVRPPVNQQHLASAGPNVLQLQLLQLQQ